MKDRTSLLLAIMPSIDNIDKDLKSKEIELFQNKVLRPILKLIFQDILLIKLI